VGLTDNKDTLASRLPLMGPAASKDALVSILKGYRSLPGHSFENKTSAPTLNQTQVVQLVSNHYTD
jgi:hypothetical protein